MSEPGFARILAFDCSGASCSAALWIEGRIAAARFAAMERGQAEALLPQLRDVMAEAGLDFPDLDGLATTIGPGSFTGLRIGLAAARGLALAAAKPLLAFTGFEALLAGQAEPEHRPVAVAIDSRRGPVFAQVFDAAGTPVGPPASVEPGDFDSWLPSGPMLILADATADLPAPGPGRSLRRAAIRASDVARIAAALGPAGIGRLDPAPLYLRAPDVTLPRKRLVP